MCADELTVRVCVCTVEVEVDGCKKCMPNQRLYCDSEGVLLRPTQI